MRLTKGISDNNTHGQRLAPILGQSQSADGSPNANPIIIIGKSETRSDPSDIVSCLGWGIISVV